MSAENPLWGAPRIHGELLKLGFEVAQSSVAKYMVKGRGPPSHGWHAFLRNHAPDIAAMVSKYACSVTPATPAWHLDPAFLTCSSPYENGGTSATASHEPYRYQQRHG
jgi:hypothetical protein